MGFRANAWATVWEVTEGNYGVNGRISTSRKNKDGEYVTDFSGFVTFYGPAAEAAKKLSERDRIKIVSCDVTNSFNKDTKEAKNYFKIYEFETSDGESSSKEATTPKKAASKKPAIDEGFNEDEECPF